MIQKTLQPDPSGDTQRRRQGEFFTPLPFAKKALEYIEKTLGKEWWKSEKYRLWDMAAGIGNLEHLLPQEALRYCYLSTYYQEDAEHLERLFPAATVFQYDYLNDDVNEMFSANEWAESTEWVETLKRQPKWKMPTQLLNDLNNATLKWIIFINPPFATAQSAKKHLGESKAGVSDTAIRKQMHDADLGEVSRELFAQFLFRINKEFVNKTAFLGLFSTLKYLNANNDQKLRDKFFPFRFRNGFMFSSVHFHGTSRSSPFPVGFLFWELTRNQTIEKQTIILDVFEQPEKKCSAKKIVCVHRNEFLNKWIRRFPTTQIFPPFSSALVIGGQNKDVRDKVSDSFLGSLMCPGNDFQSQGKTAILSGPAVSAGGLSITADNFEQAMVVHAARRIPKSTWLNDRDQWLKPNTELTSEFVADCTIWNLFCNSNQTVAMKDVQYKNKTYQIRNHFFPFPIETLKRWKRDGDREIKTDDADVAPTGLTLYDLSEAEGNFKNSFVANWLAQQKQQLSAEAKRVLNQAKEIYRFYFRHLKALRTTKFRIETFDAGWWQIQQALKDGGLLSKQERQQYEQIHNELRCKHEQLRQKILSQLIAYGMIQTYP